MQKITVKGNTVEEKIAHIERILRSFVGRLTKQTTVLRPHIPVGCFIRQPHEDGFLFAFPLSMSGSVEKAFLSFKNADPKKFENIEFSILHESGNDKVQTFTIATKGKGVIKIAQDVKEGDIFFFYCDMTATYVISDVTLSFNIAPDKKFFIEEETQLPDIQIEE